MRFTCSLFSVFRHLNGCVLESKYFSRPHLMIADAFNATYNQSRRRQRDEQLMSMNFSFLCTLLYQIGKFIIEKVK